MLRASIFQVLCSKAWTLKPGTSKPQVANRKDILVVDARPEATEFGLGLSGILKSLRHAFDYGCSSSARQELLTLCTPAVPRGLRDELVDSVRLATCPAWHGSWASQQVGQQKKEAGHSLSTFIPCTNRPPSARSLSQSNAV